MGEECRWRETIPLTRLHIVVEGQTEEAFANNVLAPELARSGIALDARRIATGRRHGRTYRGGLLKYTHLAQDLELWMKQDRKEDSWFTTMIDLYALPTDFPGMGGIASTTSAFEKATHLETAFQTDIVRRLDGASVSRRFIPYIQVHEFEALLFSRPDAFAAAFPDQTRALRALASIRASVPSPEHINDGPTTAPSKRILNIFPDYQKPSAGVLIAQNIGLTVMRAECRKFDSWLRQIMALPGP